MKSKYFELIEQYFNGEMTPDEISAFEKELEKDPEFPEAIFLKAQIEWEGFKSGSLARKNLDKVLELVKDDEPFRKRVSNYYMLLIKNEGDKDVS